MLKLCGVKTYTTYMQIKRIRCDKLLLPGLHYNSVQCPYFEDRSVPNLIESSQMLNVGKG